MQRSDDLPSLRVMIAIVWQRLEKLLEDALIKVTAVASRIDTMSVREMLEALIVGQRDRTCWRTWPAAG